MINKLRPLLLHRCWSRIQPDRLQPKLANYYSSNYSSLSNSQRSKPHTRCFSSSVGAYFRHKTVLIPHDSKKHRGGEDAAATSDTILVVADGVGGWAQENVNPGLYSSLLTKTLVELSDNQNKNSLPTRGTKTKRLAELVHDANWIAATAHLGSATCTAVTITSPTTISTVNVGDSGYALFRVVPENNPNRTTTSDSGEKRPTTTSIQLVYETVPGQVKFNFPHQLGGQYGDAVKDVGVEMTHDFENGDILVVFSDGVSDNMTVKEFLPCIDQYLNEDAVVVVGGDDDDDDDDHKIKMDELLMSYSLVADCIARKAYVLGKDEKFDSPFAKGARAAGWGDYRGGKDDDITVTVAQVFVGTKPILETDTDPHYSESIYLYTGPIPPVSELPTKEQLLSYSHDRDHDIESSKS